jgi:hypothetical protein
MLIIENAEKAGAWYLRYSAIVGTIVGKRNLATYIHNGETCGASWAFL